jgi:hypothetical protein
MIPCSCEKYYVGEIGCSIKIRIQKHVIDIKHNYLHSYSLAKHSNKTKHHIYIDEAKIVAKINHHFNKKKIKKTIERKLDNINRNNGWKINKSWIPILSST